MTARRRNLMIFGACVSVVIVLAVSAISRPGGDVPVRSLPASVDPYEPSSSPTSIARPSTVMPSDAVSESNRRSYAIATSELSGLPPQAEAGAHFELWVSWEPPVTKQPRLQRLSGDIRLERIVPPVTPTGPEAAILSVRMSDIPDLLYADRYGALSVTAIP